MAQHQGGFGLPNAVIGNERETLVREYLQKVFPPHYRFTSGAITDASGGLTGQVDIVVEYPFSCSFPMPSSADRLVLADCVLATLEVKSHLADQWPQVMASVCQVKSLQRNVTPLMYFGHAPSTQIPCIAVGYRGHMTVDALQRRLASTPEECRPDAALVLESGCFAGYGCQATGSAGLYALCSVLMHSARQLQAAAPDMFRYLSQ
jgi:hypothetical protein